MFTEGFTKTAAINAKAVEKARSSASRWVFGSAAGLAGGALYNKGKNDGKKQGA
jgi:hypothetical protein